MPLLNLEQQDAELADFVGQCYDDPLRFVVGCYPWGEPGPLERFEGPDTWQREALIRIGEEVKKRRFNGVDAVRPIRIAASSGHGVGKSTLQAWLVDWIMSTRPRCRGTVTANTATQLDTKTWAAIQTWTKRCITADWFECNSARFYRKGQRESWFCAPQSCKEENSEAFAGQHAADSTSFYIVDEGSAVPDVIYEVSEGGLTDGEPMIFVFGNCTRSHGMFHRICFGDLRKFWNPIIVDARDSRFTNKDTIEEWRKIHGEDSDFFRVRVTGLAPSASDLQFISTASVSAAQTRKVTVLPSDPLVAGLDVARGGSDELVLRFRRGKDARSIPPIRVPGEKARDSMKMATMVGEALGRDYREYFPGIPGPARVSMLFVDATGGSIGGPIADRLRQLGHKNVIDVQFGGDSPDPKYANMRAYIWGQTRDWLPGGAIDSTAQLETDLTGPGYHHDKRDRIVLESKEDMKKRGVDSPDDGDSLACTFAAPVAPLEQDSATSDEPFTPSPWG